MKKLIAIVMMLLPMLAWGKRLQNTKWISLLNKL